MPVEEETKTDLKKIVLESDEENKERNLEEVLRDVPVKKEEETKPITNLYGGGSSSSSNFYGNQNDLYGGNNMYGANAYSSQNPDFEGVRMGNEREDRMDKYNSLRKKEKEEENQLEGEHHKIRQYRPRQ